MRISRNHFRTRRVFNTAKEIWPDTIDISERLEAHPDAIAFSTPSGVFPRLSHAWDEAEELAHSRGYNSIDNLIDDLAVWAMFCALHEMAEKRAPNGVTKLFKNDVRMARFDYQMRRNLNGDECWRLERDLYNAANSEKRSIYYNPGRKLMYSNFKPNYRKNR